MIQYSTIKFEYLQGTRGIATSPFTSDWYQMPYAHIAYISGAPITLQFKDGDNVHVPENHVYIIKPNVHYRNTYKGGEPLHIRWAFINYSIYDGFDLFNILNPPIILPLNRSKKIGRILKSLRPKNARSTGGLQWQCQQQKNGFHLLSEIIQWCKYEKTICPLSDENDLMIKVIQYIHENLSQKIQRRDLATLACLSESRFHVIFKKATGLAPLDYVKHEKIKLAQKLLVSTEKSIAEISKCVGHADQFHFSNQFKKITGERPLSYRNSMSALL